MADIRIKDLTTLESASLTGDVFVIDGTTGTRKLSAFNPTFGGNATVTGTLTANGTLTATSTAGAIRVSGAGITMDTDGVGASASLRFVDGATPRFWIYKLSGDDNLYFRDMTNGRMQLQMLPGATSSNAISTFNSILSVTSTTASTSTSSGALVVGNGTSGGLGVGGSIYAGDNINSVNPQGKIQIQGTGNTTGVKEINLLRSDGGDACTLGLTGSAYNGVFLAGGLGNNEAFIYNAAPFRVFIGTASTTRFDFTSSQFKINPTTISNSTSSGALVVSGGVGVGGNITLGGGVNIAGAASDPLPAGTSGIWTLSGSGLRINSAGVTFASLTGTTLGTATVTVNGTTASSAYNVGALVVSGGVGVGNEVSVYGRVRAQLGLHADGNVPAGLAAAYQTDVQSGTTRDILSFGNSVRAGLIRGYQDGGGFVQWSFGRYTASLFEEQMRLSGTTAASSSLAIYGTTASTSTSSGALVVSGGLGVGGAIVAGDTITSTTSTNSGVLQLNLVNSSTGNAASSLFRFNAGTRTATLQAYNDTHATLAGQLRVGTSNGDIVLIPSGVAVANFSSANVTLSGDLLFFANSTYDIGTTANRVRQIFVRDIYSTFYTPASATDTGTAGRICYDSNYIYICTATNTWKRAAISTW